MFHSTLFSALFLAAFGLMISSCGHGPKVLPPEPVAPTVKEVSVPPSNLTTHYTVLEFAAGETSLTSPEQEKIKNLARASQRYGRPVSEVRVLAWSDDTSLKDPALAAQRASRVRALIKSDLKSTAPVSLYNMSEDPEKFADLIHEKDPKKKTTFENTEAPSFGKGPKSSIAGNKNSKAIIIIRYE